MANEYVNKVVVGGVTKLDLTGDTVDPEHLMAGYTAHDSSGAPILGTGSVDDWDLLWENSSPSSSFAAQTIPLDLTNYGGVYVIYKFGTNGSSTTSAISIKGEYAVASYNYSNLTTSATGVLVVYRRNVSCTDSGVTFSAGTTKSTTQTTAGTTSNTVMIPLAIYGIKGIEQ